jgi:hypothetical protein
MGSDPRERDGPWNGVVRAAKRERNRRRETERQRETKRVTREGGRERGAEKLSRSNGDGASASRRRREPRIEQRRKVSFPEDTARRRENPNEACEVEANRPDGKGNGSLSLSLSFFPFPPPSWDLNNEKQRDSRARQTLPGFP